MDWLKQAPFLRLVLFVIVGIIIQYYTDISSVWLYLFFLSVLLLALSFIKKIKQDYLCRWMFGVGLLGVGILSGSFLMKQSWDRSSWEVSAKEYEYLVCVLDEPAEKPKTMMCRVEILSAERYIYSSVRGKKAIIYLPKDSQGKQVVAGDCLSVYVRLEKPKPFASDPSFNYPLYLRKQSFASVGFVRKNNWNYEQAPLSLGKKISFVALSARRILLKQLKIIVPDKNSYSVAAALMFGYKNDLDRDLRQRFSNIGAAHVLAVSGLHFSIVFGMFSFLFSFLGFTPRVRLIRLIFMLPLIWGFAFLTGFSPSVVRAAIMMTVWLVGNTFFRRGLTMNTVAVAAFFMLIANPLYLFDVGFQLSFSAVVAIVLINPYFKKLYRSRNPILNYSWDMICVSTSAQLGVMPLSILYFHQIPLIFWLTNILIIPLVTILLFLIPVSLLISFIFSLSSMFPLSEILGLFIRIVTVLDNIPKANVSDVYISQFQVLSLYLSFLLIAQVIKKKRIYPVCILFVLVLINVLYYLC